jgi:HK97 family phage major capsid protein
VGQPIPKEQKNMNMSLVELREEQIEAHVAFQAAVEAIKEAGEDADLDALEATLTAAEERYNTVKVNLAKTEEREHRARQKFELDRKTLDAGKRLEGRDPAAPRVGVTSEPLTYRRGGPHSMFTDLYKASKFGDQQATERLNRHQQEMVVEQRIRAGESYDLSSTDTAGGHLVAPLYLNDQFVTLARANRVAANVLGARPLPQNTDSVVLPRMSTGTAVANQSGDADGGAVTETDAVFDTITGAVKTKAGMQDVSQQLVDRSVPGIDEVIFSDLVGAYAVALDVDVINSSATSNKGLLQVSGANSVTYTAATPTVAGLYPKLADAIQQVHTGIYMPPTAILMHPRRWAWILASLDGNNRPLITPYAPQNAAGDHGGVVSEGLVGSVQGVPVYVDANIPATLGSGTNEDRIIVVRKEECYLYEESSGPFLETFRDVGSGTLTVRFRLHNYWAQINERRPDAVSIISGTGLAAPSF